MSTFSIIEINTSLVTGCRHFRLTVIMSPLISSFGNTMHLLGIMSNSNVGYKTAKEKPKLFQFRENKVRYKFKLSNNF